MNFSIKGIVVIWKIKIEPNLNITHFFFVAILKKLEGNCGILDIISSQWELSTFSGLYKTHVCSHLCSDNANISFH